MNIIKNKKEHHVCSGETIIIENDNYVLHTHGSLLKEINFNNEGKETSREVITIEQARSKFPENSYLENLKYSDLPNYGDDFF